MSLDVLKRVFDDITKITEITNKFDDLKNELNDETKDIKSLLDKSKTLIESLYDTANSIKDEFLSNLNTVNCDLIENKVDDDLDGNVDDKKDPLSDVDLDATPSLIDSSVDNVIENDADNNKENEDEETTPTTKPTIKLVDINKLVEPKTIIKKDDSTPKEKKSVQFDSSVIIITDSDDEKSSKGRRSKRYSNIKNSKRSTRLCLNNNSDSDSDSDSESSDIDSINDNNNKQSLSKKHKIQSINNGNLSVLDYNWKDDVKFKSECVVNVLRVPCEEMKRFYSDKNEFEEIKKLTDLSTLKRRRNSRDSNSPSDSDKRIKKKTKKITVNNSNDSSSSSSPSSSEIESKSDHLNSPDLSPLVINNIEDNEMNGAAELALASMDSDKEISSDSDDVSNNEALKIQEEPIEENDKTAEIIPETDDDDKSNKNEESEIETPNKTDDNGDKNEETETNSIELKKKKWRKDKLLTEKLSDTDSESGMKKFLRKKEDMKQKADGNNDDDDEEEIQTVSKKKKKLVKKKSRLLSDSDSDSDDDNKKKNSDEDFKNDESKSSSSSAESEKEKEEKEDKKKKPRKRVKRIQDSSDESDGKSTRKHIRRVLGRDDLSESTLVAENEEKERKARILDKQRKYNQIFENSDYEAKAKVDKIVLDFDEKTKTELLKVDDNLVSKLKPHQAAGIRFMWDACFESIKRAKETKGSGCILAHCMGLGKTLQVIALTHTLLTNYEKTQVKKVMVVCPLNTVLNWVNEYKQWIPNNTDFDVFELVSFKQNVERQYQLQLWHENGGVLIIGYEMFRNLSNPENKRIYKKYRVKFQEALVDPGPDLVICDEGHLLKNEKTNISIAMNRLKTMRRIVLTGTPLQNNLKEYFCMVQFIKPNLLGTYKEYLNRFVNPITNGQYTDSTLHDIQIMRRRSHVLHKLLDGVVQRRDYSVLQPYLPPKHEYVLFLSLTDIQIKLYEHYMTHFARRTSSGAKTSFLFIDFQSLQRICTHPRVLLDKSIEDRNKEIFLDEDSEGSLKDFIDDEDDEDTSTNGSDSDNSGEDDKVATTKTTTSKRRTRATAAENNDDDDNDIEIVEAKEWWQQYCDGEELNNIENSSKLFLLFEILKECEQIGDKVLVFSQSLYSLNVIEYFLGKIHDATQEGSSLNGYTGSWCLGLDYFRLDGSSSCDNRNIWCKHFNDPKNYRSRLFLISTKAGGLGINLVAANRVIIFDVSWNPSHDIQSIYRVYRFGQTKPCYIYRFVTYGTMEMKVYERQVTKQAISKRVIDEQQIDRHYNQHDLLELYNFDPRPDDRPIPLVPKDVLLGELLQNYEDRIYKYHEHQSLLENKEEEGLNEEERKAAWEEFENEKIQRNTSLFMNNFGNHTEPIPGMMHHSVTDAIVSLVRKENPTWTEQQVRSMIPMLTMQLSESLKKGDFTFYQRVQNEIKFLRSLQAQQMKEQFYSMQRQQQQQQFLQQQGFLHNPFQAQQHFLQRPGTSQLFGQPNTITEIVDLNDE